MSVTSSVTPPLSAISLLSRSSRYGNPLKHPSEFSSPHPFPLASCEMFVTVCTDRLRRQEFSRVESFGALLAYSVPALFSTSVA